MEFHIRELDGITELDELAVDAEQDGRRMVSQLISEWRTGANHFDQPGERLYAAMLGDRVAGVCGLNRDPYAEDESIGRVRRLYVSSRYRRMGIASALIARMIRDAATPFRFLQARTYEKEASAFYRSCGFAEVVGDEFCTHRIELTERSG